MKFFQCLVLSFIFIQLNSIADIVIISDLDDTVRQTNVIDRAGRMRTFFKGVKPFTHLRDFYKSVGKWGEENDEKVFYHFVSSSHRVIYNGKRWLRKYGFPFDSVTQRRVFGRNYDWRNSVRYKSKVIKNIISKHSTSEDTFLFFGDNGQEDPGIYKKAIETHEILNYSINIRDIAASATKLIKDINVERIDDVHYFLSERDLLSGEFNHLDPYITYDWTDEVNDSFDNERIVPRYVTKSLGKRIAKKRCRKMNRRSRKTCKRAALKEAKKAIKRYYQR